MSTEKPKLAVLAQKLDILRWEEVVGLAVQLGVDFSELQKIEGQQNATLKALNIWLATDTEASWKKVVDALRAIKKNVLADEIERERCSSATASQQPIPSSQRQPAPLSFAPSSYSEGDMKPILQQSHSTMAETATTQVQDVFTVSTSVKDSVQERTTDSSHQQTLVKPDKTNIATSGAHTTSVQRVTDSFADDQIVTSHPTTSFTKSGQQLFTNFGFTRKELEDLMKEKCLEEHSMVLEWIAMRKQTIEAMRYTADEIDENYKNINISRIVGAGTAIAGGAMALGGSIATLATVGLAASVTAPIIAAGVGMSIAGGVTSAGASIADIIISKLKLSDVQKQIDADNEILQQMVQLSSEI